ncbi:MAG: TIGR01212 family radical SAM protein [Clostridia bacterium]|nr:TIGR01212 family radical SAM protein [Clostridia bacterium]
MLYNNLSSYFRKKHGKRLKKICIDGGFGCPNRDGTCGVGGCIYCGERGAGEHIDEGLSIEKQVKTALSKAGDEELFVAYFQSFTNTYAPLEILKKRYDEALIDDRIVHLAIGTRPDCIDEDIASLIASYKNRVGVWVELGLQTANDKTAYVINRGYDTSVFERALKILEKYEIPVCVHLIVGLPGEGEEEIKATCKYLSRFEIWGVKIHSIFVMKNTRLADMYYNGEYEPPTLDEYVRLASYIISHLSKKIIIHRITGDCPKELLVAPSWNENKNEIIEKIQNYLKENSISQGSLYGDFK